jgi:hypothetical protein
MQAFNKEEYMEGLSETGVSVEARHMLNWLVSIDDSITHYGNIVMILLCLSLVTGIVALIHFW